MITYRVTTWTSAFCKRSYQQASSMLDQIASDGGSAILVIENGPLKNRVQRMVGTDGKALVERHRTMIAKQEKSCG